MEEEADLEIKKASLGNNPNVQKVGQEQVHKLLFGEKLSWKAIIYDLINSEQLNPWDIDISLLSTKYLEKIRDLEEHNFFVSSKVLLAAALLLRIKSEILLNYDLKNLNDALFGKKEVKKYVQERIEFDEDVPDLIPRTPLPRFRRVTLQELMSALGKAIKTETRRIKRVTLERQHEIEAAVALPRKGINLKEEIKRVYGKLREIFKTREDRLAFSHLAGEKREDRIAHFVPLLHLDNQKKVWLEQHEAFDEIWILLRDMYEKQNREELLKLEREVDEEMKLIEAEEKMEEEIIEGKKKGRNINAKANLKGDGGAGSNEQLTRTVEEKSEGGEQLSDEELKKEIMGSFKNPIGDEAF